jgi:hypothetical protein
MNCFFIDDLLEDWSGTKREETVCIILHKDVIYKVGYSR